MTKATLLTGTTALLFAATPLYAQTAAPAPATDERAELRAEIAQLKAAVATLEARLDRADGIAPSTATAAVPPQGQTGQLAQTTPPAPAAKDKPTEIGWKGSPQFTQGDAKFKVKGRIQYDAGYLFSPANTRAKGFSNEFRRLRLGGEGALGSGFGYKLEAELSDNAVRMVDTFITYQKGKWLVTLGNHNNFQGLDELISDTAGSVMERAAFTTAFNNERRLGLSTQYQSGPWLLQGGLFTDSIDSIADTGGAGASTETNGGDKNDSYGVDGRAVFAPRIGKNQLHFAINAHYRDLNRLGEGTQRYRVRPYLHSVNDRYLAARVDGAASDGFKVLSDTQYGAEAAGVFGRFHYAGELHWLTAARPGAADPTFFGGYGEVGFFLTPGDSRPYSNGILGTPKPARPFGKGGPGAIQLNLRYDYLSLNDRSAGISGGTQNGVIAGLIWTPIQFVRLNMNYAHMAYTDALTIPATASSTRSDYDVDVFAMRAELDF
ncbi:MAG TPA: porin [Sphingobium sp.]